MRTRLWAGVVALGVVGAGLGVRGVAAGAVAKYAGDALYTVLILVLVVLIAPRVRPPVAAGVALGFSWGVEVFQLSGVPAELGAHSALARLVLGTSFNAPDLFWYAIGAAVGWAGHRAVWKARPSKVSIPSMSGRFGRARKPTLLLLVMAATVRAGLLPPSGPGAAVGAEAVQAAAAVQQVVVLLLLRMLVLMKALLLGVLAASFTLQVRQKQVLKHCKNNF